MSSDQVAIRVDQVSKCYQLYEAPRDRLKQFLMPRLHRALNMRARRYYREFWALRDISFSVNRGETVGIVGRNGAGKSTLLQILCGTMAPTAGSVDVNGRVAALLELGSGFNPEFSGRENVYLNASILGLTRGEIDARFDEILEFADIGEFIDQPVKSYSSGMYVRLAFAVSACVDPDILIVDEALAVGDVKFQTKCFRRFDKLLERGTTILLVTHSTEQITRHCDRAILLENGSIRMQGLPKDVVNLYLDLLFGNGSAAEDSPQPEADHGSDEPKPGPRLEGSFETRSGYNPHEYRWGSGQARIVDFMLSVPGQDDTFQLPSGAPTTLTVWVHFVEAVAAPIYGLTIKTPDGVTVYGSNSRDFSDTPLIVPARAGETKRIAFKLDQHLGPGDYLISVGVAVESGSDVVPLDRRYDSIHIQVDKHMRSFGVADFHMGIEVSAE